MAIGDYLSNMFLGSAWGGDQNKPAMDELWRIYRQAYNVKPVWNGKQWVMPSGAIQRFQMLLPLIQAQMRSGQGGQQGGRQDYGLLGSVLPAAAKGMMDSGLKSVGGWGGLFTKVGDAMKGLWDNVTDKVSYSTDYGYTPQEPATFDQAFRGGDAQPFTDPQTYDLSGVSPADAPPDDWLDSIPIDEGSYYNMIENFW